MFYIYRKIDGSILSASQSAPIFAEDDTNGILVDEQVLSVSDIPGWVVRRGKLEARVGDVQKGSGARADQLQKEYLARRKRFWNVIDNPDASLQELKEALALVGQAVLPRESSRSR
jgi:hypothetical protein